jgi:hypothetical protein
VRRAAASAAGLRPALRELGLLARSGPFRVALVLSLLLHLALLYFVGWRGPGRAGEPPVPQMRVHLILLPPEPPGAPPAAPAAGR